MYAYLRGRFSLKTPTSVWVDVQGIGFEVHISLHTYEAIQSLEEGTLYVYQLVKEDAHLLYGFADQSEKEVFLHLLSVSGVGASTARMMLSSLHPFELIRTIVGGNEAGLERIKGIGKKTAQRIVLELRDKMAKISTDISTVSSLKHNTLEQDALIAMTALGIAKNMAEQAIRKALQSDASHTQVESLIKAALKCL
jgi:Holliday junction DNA helicase RuvA